jgi:hypothetical protein
MSAAPAILARLGAVGAKIECRDGNLVVRAGRRPVPMSLIQQARAVKGELSKMFNAGEAAQQREVEHLQCAAAENRRISAAIVEGAQVSAFDEHVRAKRPKTLTEDAQASTFDEPEDFCGSQPVSISKVLTSPLLSAFDENEHLRREWGDAEAEPAAIVEYDGDIPRAWAEGFARLHPDRPPGDVPPKRWLRFIDDIGLFLDCPFCAVAAALGWGPYDLFGCDRDRPFACIDQTGLLWLLNGNRLMALSENTATIELRTGVRQIYRHKSSDPGRVLAWELVDGER